jgi:hypothetical protein
MNWVKQYERAVRRRRIVNRAGVIMFVAVMAMAVVLAIKIYIDVIYPIDRDVITHLDFAAKQTSADAIARELELAIKGLSKYHGNPVWIMPTVATDFDYIRNQLEEQYKMALNMSKLSPSDYAYQRYVENAIRTLPQYISNLNTCKKWLIISPQNLATFAILVALMAVAYKLATF